MTERTIRVIGSAKVSGTPDWVVISFSINSKNYKYEKCMEHLARQTESLREELTTVGLEKESLKTIHFDIDTNREYDHINKKHVFKGYTASHELRVEFPMEKDYLNKVLNVLSNTKSQASFDISFKINDPEPFRRQVIRDAVKNSKDKAKVLADAAGTTLGEILQIDYSWSEIHFESTFKAQDMMVTKTMPDFDFAPEDVDVSDSVTIIWAIK